MNLRLPLTVAGIVFALVALMHLLRVIYQWPILIATMSIPMYVSMIGFVVALALAIWMFVARSKI